MTGCDIIHAMVNRLTSGGKDRRILGEEVRALTRDIARKAAQAAATAAQEGEI
jgi:hypothetical protein